MKKLFNQKVMVVMIFTTLLLTFSCKKEKDPLSVPVGVYPANNSTISTLVSELKWTVCIDQAYDTVFYDVYLDTISPPKLLYPNLIKNVESIYLAGNTKYYWRVIAKYRNGVITSSPIYNFSTAALPGNMNVVVCDQTQIKYFGGAEVYMYETETQRNLDAQRMQFNRKAITDYSDPKNIGAAFYQLPLKKFYYYARIETSAGSGKYLVGVTECYVISGGTITAILVVM